MALDFLKGSVAKLEIMVDGNVFQPGDTIHGRVILQVEDNEVNVRGGRIAILCQEKYQVRHRTHGRQGSHNTYTWKTDTVGVFHKTLMDEMTLSPHFYQGYDFDCQLPADALPSLDGKIVKVTWWVKATLDRPKAVDVNTEAGFMVYSPIQGRITTPTEPALAALTGKHQEDVELILGLPRTDWELGESIEGELGITAHKDFKLTDIRLELVQSEYVAESSGNTHQMTVKAALAGSTAMTAGQSLSLPFKIEIPSEGLPTLNAPHSKVSWNLYGTLARRLATDYHIDQPLQVYNKG
jgi:hypothetical protein